MSDVTKASDLRSKTDAELAEELLNLRKEQFNLRMQRATGQLSRPDQFAKVRRTIAQVKTILTERRRAAAKTGGAA
jgi:large subunit ribosomal protein L29